MISKKDNVCNRHHLRNLFGTLFLETTSDDADLPFLALNAAAGALIMYGLVGLRHEAWAIFQMSAIMALQSILSTQLLTGCVWYFNGQVSSAQQGPCHLSSFELPISSPCKATCKAEVSYSLDT